MPIPTTCGPGPPSTPPLLSAKAKTTTIRTTTKTTRPRLTSTTVLALEEVLQTTPTTILKAMPLSTSTPTSMPIQTKLLFQMKTTSITTTTTSTNVAPKGIKNLTAITTTTATTKPPPIPKCIGKVNETVAENVENVEKGEKTKLKFNTECCNDFSIINSNNNKNYGNDDDDDDNNNNNNRKNCSNIDYNNSKSNGIHKINNNKNSIWHLKMAATKNVCSKTTTTITSPTARKNTTTASSTRIATVTSTPSTLSSAWIPSAGSTASISIPKWLLMLLMLFGILAQMPHQVTGEKSKHYYMQSMCKNHFLQQLYRKIDGAVLWSQNERNLDCIITFQTHSILQRFMLRFDMLQLDCNDHLYVYDGAHAVAQPKIDISCRNTKQTVSSILTRTNFVTLKYVTDGWGTDANGFKLIITSVKDPKHTCKDFTCATREFCIHPDLLCDGVNHCGDNSDESVQNLCPSETSSIIFGVDMTWFVLIVVSLLLILSAVIVGISICVCRHQDDGNLNQNTAIQLHLTAETNGSSKHLHHYQHTGGGGGTGGTLSREHTQLPSHHQHHQHHHQQLPTHLPSGNWHHPAGPISGYHRIQRNLSKMSKVRPIWCLENFVN